MRSGCNIELHASGTLAKVFARLGVILADEPALEDMIDCKGHAGTKPCPLGSNASNHKAPSGATPLHVSNSFATPICETDFSKFKKYSDAGVRLVAERLAEIEADPEKTTGDLEKAEQMYGYNRNKWSIILEQKVGSTQ